MSASVKAQKTPKTPISIAVKAATEKVLMDLKLMPETITYSEIKRLYGKKFAERARMSEKIEWFPLAPKGQGFAVYCRRSEFTDFLFDEDSSINQ